MGQEADPIVVAIIENDKQINVNVKAWHGISKSEIHLSDHKGHTLDIQTTIKDDLVTIVPKEKLDYANNYRVVVRDSAVYARYSDKLLNSIFYYKGKDLGVTYTKNKVTLKVWSPTATKVEVHLYNKNNHHKEIGSKTLTRAQKGVWEITLEPKEFNRKNIDGVFYQYQVDAFGMSRKALDPYAKSMAEFTPKGKDRVGKAAIIDLKKASPENFDSDKYSNSSHMANNLDFIAQEVHVRDYTIDESSEVPLPLRGTYRGLALKSDYFKSLGITHIQLMPIQNFYTVSEKDKRFSGTELSTRWINYNWGYDPHNYFTPEGFFSSNAHDPYARILELKDMINSYHHQGIGVIMDVVYNHTYLTDTFERIAPGCYYRYDDNGNISLATGAGPSLETRRKMVAKLIIDSMKYFVEEFHINGFRFDLMGFMDKKLLLKIRKELGDDIILYGEAWEFTDLPREQAVTKSNLPFEAKVGAFNDTTRDSFTGPMSAKGIVQGATHMIPKAMAGIVGSVKKEEIGEISPSISQDAYHRFASSPLETINYLTIHDGHTLWDKINLSEGGEPHTRLPLIKLANAMLLTSQGRVVIHGGVEMARSKPLSPNDPEQHRAHSSDVIFEENGVTHFHENTYRSPDITNRINWDRGKEFEDLNKYISGLIKLRRHLPQLRLEKNTSIKHGLRFIEPVPTGKVDHDFNKKNAKFHDFNDPALTQLTVNFINGPKDFKYYLIGELHSAQDVPDSNKNPVNNTYFVDFNAQGSASITFTREQISKFDLTSWSDPDKLQIKIVKTPGRFDFPETSYSPFGNNTISVMAIKEDLSITVDLSIINHIPGNSVVHNLPYIAYTISAEENSLAPGLSPLNYKRIIVIHNFDKNNLSLNIPVLGESKKWDILVDKNRAGITPINDSEVRIENNYVTVPAKSSTVLATH